MDKTAPESTERPGPQHTRGLAALFLAATALIWGSGGLAIKLVDLPPLALTSARSALSALTLALVFRGRLNFSRAALSPARLCAAGSYAALLALNVAATKWTTAANAIFLAYTAPVYVALLAPRLLGERTRPLDWAFIAAVLCGMGLFFLDRLSAEGLLGNLAAAASGLAYAAFTLSMRAQKDASPVESVLLGHVLVALLGLPQLLTTTPAASDLLGLAYLGIVQQGLSLALYVWCIKRLGALEAMLIMTLEPILNPLLVALGTGELPGGFAVAGGAVVVGAVTLRGILQARRPTPA